MQSCVNMSRNNYIAMTFRRPGMKKSIKSSLNSKHLMTPLPHCLFSMERNYLMEIPVQLMLLKKILLNYVIVRFICSNQPASQKIIWSRFTTVRIVKTLDTLVIKNANVSKKRS